MASKYAPGIAHVRGLSRVEQLAAYSGNQDRKLLRGFVEDVPSGRVAVFRGFIHQLRE